LEHIDLVTFKNLAVSEHTQGMSNYLKKKLLTPDHFQFLVIMRSDVISIFKSLPNAAGIVQKMRTPINIMCWGLDCLTYAQLNNCCRTPFGITASES